MRRLLQWAVLGVSVFALASCSVGTYRQANDSVNTQGDLIQQFRAASNTPAAAVLVKDAYYVDANPIQFANYPRFLKKIVHFQTNDMPLELLMQQLLAGSQLVVTYDKSVQPGILVRLNYTGSLDGALKDIAEKTGYAFTIHGNHINWSAFEEKTFNISFMPGSSSYMVGGEPGTSSNGASGLAESEASNGLSSSQYSTLSGTLSIWSELRDTLNRLKSPMGEVIVSEATTTVTVRDHPENVAEMAAYIKKLNTILSQQVSIKIQVLELQLSKNYQYGINWALVNQRVGNLAYSIAGQAGDSSGLGSAALATQSGASALTKITVGDSKASNAVIDALSEQGKLSVSTEPTVVTLNDQIASLRITQNTAYLKSVSTTVANDGGPTTSTLKAGSITDGYTLYVLPKIQNDQVYMQISSNLANLISMSKASSGSEEQGNANAIEVPVVSNKSFNQRSRVKSGETLIVAGFSSIKNQTVSSSPFGVTPLGGQGADKNRVETIVLITPTILSSQN